MIEAVFIIDLNKPRIRAALAAVLALAPVPGGFTVAEHAPGPGRSQATTGTPPARPQPADA